MIVENVLDIFTIANYKLNMSKCVEIRCDFYNDEEEILDAEILCLYSENGMLNIEIKGDEKDD